MDITSQAVALLESRIFNPNGAFIRIRVNQVRIHPRSIVLKGETLWADSDSEIEKPFEVAISCPISSNSQIQFL